MKMVLPVTLMDITKSEKCDVTAQLCRPIYKYSQTLLTNVTEKLYSQTLLTNFTHKLY